MLKANTKQAQATLKYITAVLQTNVSNLPRNEGCSLVTVVGTSAGPPLPPHLGPDSVGWPARGAAMPADSARSWCPCRFTHMLRARDLWGLLWLQACVFTYLSQKSILSCGFPEGALLSVRVKWKQSDKSVFRSPQLLFPNTYKQSLSLSLTLSTSV